MIKNTRGLIMFFCFVAFLVLGFITYRENPEETANVFVHDNIVIAADQVVGRLMVAGGDANVFGGIMDGIIIVDGNLRVEVGANVQGEIFVFGGSVIIKQGAEVEHQPLVIVPQGHPLVPIMVAMIFLLGSVSLILLPVLFWLLGHFFKKTAWYSPVKEKIQILEQRWPSLYIIAGFGISASMLIIFIRLSWETLVQNRMIMFDDSFIWLIRYFANPIMNSIMLLITDIGFGTSYVIAVGITLVLLVYRKRWLETGALVICLSGGGLLSFILKNLFHRARPNLLHLVQETSYSFPSGHALASMCFYGMLGFLIMRNMTTWRGRLTVMTLTVILILAIGISRIYLGAHYPTDVVAGYAVGFMWLYFCISLLLWWEKTKMNKKQHYPDYK